MEVTGSQEMSQAEALQVLSNPKVDFLPPTTIQVPARGEKQSVLGGSRAEQLLVQLRGPSRVETGLMRHLLRERAVVATVTQTLEVEAASEADRRRTVRRRAEVRARPATEAGLARNQVQAQEPARAVLLPNASVALLTAVAAVALRPDRVHPDREGHASLAVNRTAVAVRVLEAAVAARTREDLECKVLVRAPPIQELPAHLDRLPTAAGLAAILHLLLDPRPVDASNKNKTVHFSRANRRLCHVQPPDSVTSLVFSRTRSVR